MQQTRLDFEPGSQTLLSVPISITLSTHKEDLLIIPMGFRYCWWNCYCRDWLSFDLYMWSLPTIRFNYCKFNSGLNFNKNPSFEIYASSPTPIVLQEAQSTSMVGTIARSTPRWAHNMIGRRGFYELSPDTTLTVLHQLMQEAWNNGCQNSINHM